jgi:putative methylase
LEQIVTPPETAAEMLEAAYARGDLHQRQVLDLGSGTGTLSIGAALLGATRVRGVEIDPTAIEIARANAVTAGVSIDFELMSVEAIEGATDTVLMNPPFGAQTRYADRPFWETAFRQSRTAIYAFALAGSRTFIAQRAVARGARIEETRPVDWELPRTFPHHVQRRVTLPVDLWVLRMGLPP